MKKSDDRNIYIHKLDLDQPGLFVVHIHKPLPRKAYDQIHNQLEEKIKRFSKDSEVLILGPEFGPVEFSSKKETEPPNHESL